MAVVPVRASYHDSVTNSTGDVQASASVTVYDVGTTDKISETIYSDATGAGTLANPFTADAAGRFQFYLNVPQRVDLYISKDGLTPYTLEDVDVIRTGESGAATFLVAASDASTAQLLKGDWGADGTADEEDINAAIAALPS